MTHHAADRIEVDSARNVWITNNYNSDAQDFGQKSVFQAIGLADPVVTPDWSGEPAVFNGSSKDDQVSRRRSCRLSHTSTTTTGGISTLPALEGAWLLSTTSDTT